MEFMVWVRSACICGGREEDEVIVWDRPEGGAPKMLL